MRVPLTKVLQSLGDWAGQGRAVDIDPAACAGRWLAQDIRAPGPVPTRAIALRDGFAVEALALIGASAQNPVPLMAAPRVRIGEALPGGTDAVIDPTSIEQQGRLLAALNEIEPGAGIRREGHDLAAGALIARRGMRVTPEVAFAAQGAGIVSLPVADVTYRVATGDGALDQWFATRFIAVGSVPSEGSADIDIVPAQNIPAALALSSAEAVQVERGASGIRIALPAARLDAAMVVWCAVLLPLLAQRLGVGQGRRRVRLRQKIASALGMADVALLRVTGDDAEVLATGDLPLSAIAAANAFLIIDAASEGEAAGAMVDATMLDAPFTELETP